MNFKLTKSSLNFKVYTSPTIPASGTENDIVIISSTPMDNWILSSDAPTGEPMNNGDVWIQYSASGNVFDIMNQHDFMLAITKIYQYVSGTWLSADARRYVGGVWDVVSSTFSASINITYPAKSTCVVKNSSGTTVASNTNTGSSTKTWTATVGATGTYTVTATATDGSGKSKSQSVSITTDGQSESVTLAYELLLYDAGNQYTEVTGGWKNNGGTFTLNSDSMVLEGGYHTEASAFINNLVDLTDYNTLYFTLAYSDDSSSREGAIGISNSNTKAAPSYAASISGINGNVSKTTKDIDISSITGSYYVGFSVIQNVMTVYKVWAE